MAFASKSRFLDDLVSRKTVEIFNEFQIIKIPGFSELSDDDQDTVRLKILAEQEGPTPLDLDAVNTALRDYSREITTPPPDYEADLARDRELERQSRMSLLGAGCPPCYPTDLKFPVEDVSGEHEVIAYWKSLPGNGHLVLTKQLSDWKDFLQYQQRVRRYFLPRNTFPKFLERVRHRRRRHGLEENVAILPDSGQQSQLETWTEFQNYHLDVHETIEEGLQEYTEKLKSAQKDGPRELAFFENAVENLQRKLREHEKLLRWIEKHRNAILAQLAAATENTKTNSPHLPTPPSTASQRRGKTNRCPLSAVQTGVQKPRRRTRQSSRLRKPPRAQTTKDAPEHLSKYPDSVQLSGAEKISSRPPKNNTSLRPVHPQRVGKSARNSQTRRERATKVNNITTKRRQKLKDRSRSRISVPDSVKTRSGRLSERPERFGLIPVA